MALSKKVISQFVKNTTNNKKTKKKETFVQGYIVFDSSNGQYYVKLYEDSENLIPARMSTNIDVERPVNVMIKNHLATVIGNVAEVSESSGTGTGGSIVKKRVLNDTSSSEIKSISSEDIELLWDEYF